MKDPLRGYGGELLDMWHCPDCDTHIHLHDDPGHDSHDWSRDFIREHEYVHAEQLENHHNGDRGMMRLALKYPHLHAGIIEVHGPTEGLADEHRRQILEAADISEE